MSDKIEVDLEMRGKLIEKYPALIGMINSQVDDYIREFNINPFSEFSKDVELRLGSVTETIRFRHTEWKAQPSKEQIEQSRLVLGETYEKIIMLLDEYQDTSKDNKTIIALWAIASHFYKEFPTFPYLFFNAMRSGGKTRICKIMSYIAWNGLLLMSLKESTIFRTAGKHTLGIDEFEQVGKKEQENLRELLNAAYKKGLKVIRMKKVKKWTKDQETGKDKSEEVHEMEAFEPYTPIYMANIWGMEEVLGSRCINIILEKSNNNYITKKTEDFDNNILISLIKTNLSTILVQLCSYFHQKSIYANWNLFINDRYNTLISPSTYTTLNTQTTQLHPDLESFFLKIDGCGLSGRDLELWFPLFIVAKIMDEQILEEILRIAKSYVENRREEEVTESKDIQLYDFVSKKEENEWYDVKQLTFLFRQFTNQDENEDNWLNSKWVGRALKRLNVVLQKRRISEGIQVMLNVNKAKKQMEMFR